MVDIGSEQEAPVGELVGIGIAIILLWVLFRSERGDARDADRRAARRGLRADRCCMALAAPLGLPSFAAVIATMLGLGAGIDYALLIIGRYREQVAAGDSRRDASAKSAATSGASVVAAGLIVMLAIAGLLVIGIPFIGKLGIGAAIAVGGVVVSALTILPIMIGAFGRWLTPKKPEHVQPSPGFERWGELVTARPWLSIARRRAAAADLRRAGHAAAPRPARRRQPARGQAPADRLRPAERGVRPGLQRPVPHRRRHPAGRRRQPRPTSTSSRRRSPAPTAWPQAAPAHAERGRRDGHDLRHPDQRPAGQGHQRAARPPARGHDPAGHRRARRSPGKVFVGGATPVFEDLSDKVASRLPLFISTVIGLQRPAADHGLPVALDPARLGRLQPAVGARRLRRRRRRLPGGHRRLAARRRLRRPDRVLHPGHAVRDPVRAEHGLQRLPAQPRSTRPTTRATGRASP